MGAPLFVAAMLGARGARAVSLEHALARGVFEVCVASVDARGVVRTGHEPPGARLVVPRPGAARAADAEVVFSTPLTPNRALGSGRLAASCRTFEKLTLGKHEYGPEAIDGAAGALRVLGYHDLFGPADALVRAGAFVPFGACAPGTPPGPGCRRDGRADGVVFASDERPLRSVLVLHEVALPDAPAFCADVVATDGQAPIEGVGFALFRGDVVVGLERRTEGGGRATVCSAAPGPYTVRQTSAPRGWGATPDQPVTLPRACAEDAGCDALRVVLARTGPEREAEPAEASTPGARRVWLWGGAGAGTLAVLAAVATLARRRRVAPASDRDDRLERHPAQDRDLRGHERGHDGEA